MRLQSVCLGVSAGLICIGACAPELINTGADGPAGIVAGAVTTGSGDGGGSADQTTPPTTAQGSLLTGNISGSGDYELFNLGASIRGEQWTVDSTSGLLSGRSFLVVLLDADHDLLRRQIVSPTNPLQHTLRTDTDELYVGVAGAFGSSGGDFRLDAQLLGGGSVPAPRRAIVYLNFAAASNVSIHSRNGISFPSFAGDMLGGSYAGATDAIKDAIVEAVQEDYAAYEMVVMSSDEGPPPESAHSTVHFGSTDPGLLGLADSVDQYNEDTWQDAIIYVGSFSDFEVMDLTAEEMGQMVGNVASHELGHLLGLFHTQVPEDIMDTTGSAWDLAGDQSFLRAALEPSVFPTGFENTPVLLGQIIGYNPDAKARDMSKPLSEEKLRSKIAVRSLARRELRSRCGNCLHPD